MHSDVPLPREISSTEINDDISDANASILQQLADLFKGTNLGSLLQQNRGRLGNAINDLRSKLGINKDNPGDTEPLRTFGDLRVTAGRVSRVLREVSNPPGGGKTDPTVGRLLEEEWHTVRAKYIREIGQTHPVPPVVDANEPKNGNRGGVKDPADGNGKKERNSNGVMRQEHEPGFEVRQVLNANTDIVSGQFPQPLHGFVDLDLLSKKNSRNGFRDQPSTWMHLLSEPQRENLQRILSESANNPFFRNLLDAFLRQTRLPFINDTQRLTTVLDDITETTFVREQIMRMIRIDGNADATGGTVDDNELLRTHGLRQLILPNFERIIDEHFDRLSIGVDRRKLTDMDTGDGSIIKALGTHFGHRFGYTGNMTSHVSLNRERVDGLQVRLQTVESLMRRTSDRKHFSDVVLMSGGLHHMQRGNDLAVLNWAQEHLGRNGMIMLAFPDHKEDPASVAHMQSAFGIRPSSTDPVEYIDHLQRRGMTVRTMRPSLHFKVQTDNGRAALRDLMLSILPPTARRHTGKMDQYQSLIDQQGGVFTYTMEIVVAYAEQDIAPEETSPRTIVIPFLAEQNTDAGHTKHLDLKSSDGESTAAKSETLSPLPKPIIECSPAEIVAFVEQINGLAWGDETNERRLLSTINMEWAQFRSLKRAYVDNKLADEILKHVEGQRTPPPPQRATDNVWRIVFKQLQILHPDQAERNALLRDTGLRTRYVNLMVPKEERVRRPRKVREPEPVPTSITRIDDKEEVDEDEQQDKETEDPVETDAPTIERSEHRAPEIQPVAVVRNDALSPADRLLLQARAQLIQQIIEGGNSPVDPLLALRARLIATLVD